jgi:transcription termination/antitermination protein NusA
MPVTFDTDTIRLITLFENITGAPVKDCLVDENIVYLVIDEGKVGIAIGKNGNSVKHAEHIVGKMIKLFEYSSDLEKFVKNLIPQTNEVKIENKEGKIIVEIKVEKKDRALVIGRDSKNLKLFKEILHRNHKIDELIVR